MVNDCALERDGAQRRGRGGDVAVELEPRTGSARSKKTKINREYRQLMMMEHPDCPFLWDAVFQSGPTLTNGLRGPTDVLDEIHFVLDVGITDRRGRIVSHRENTRNTELTSLDAVGIWRGNQEASETRSGQCYQPFKWDLTPEDKSAPGFIGEVLKLYGAGGPGAHRRAMKFYPNHLNPNHLSLPPFFTVAEVIEIIVQFERIDRAEAHALGDHSHSLDHIFFDGLVRSGDGWSIFWGS